MQYCVADSLYNVGIIAGAFLSWPLQPVVGQRIAIVLGLFLNACAWLAITLASWLWVLYLARFVHGMSVITISPLIVMYVVETAHKNSRGWQVATLYVCKSAGLLVPVITTMAALSWRQTGIVCCVLSLVTIIGLLSLSDSPRWLMTRGRNTEALKALKYFRGDCCETEFEFTGIAEQALREGLGGILHQTRMLFRAPARHTLGLLLVMEMLIMFGGSNLIVTYLVPILQMAKTSTDPYLLSIVCFISRILSAILSACLTRRLKRKPPIIAGLMVMSFFYGVISLYFFLQRFEISCISWMPTAAIAMIMVSDGLAYPGFFALEGELLPLSCRSIGVLPLRCASGISAAVNVATFEKMLATLGMDGAFLFYGALGAIIPCIVMFCFQETHGSSLEELTMKR